MKKHLLTNSYDRGITKQKRNAFTLIELLAIIVILAIIAVITVPIILNIIENSRKGAATDSAYGYKDSVNKFYIAELQNHNKLKLDGTYTVKSDGSLEPTEDNTFGFGDSEYGNSLEVQVSGTIPSSGTLTYENNALKSGYLVIGNYRVTFNQDGTVTTEKNTSSSSSEQDNSGSETPSNPYLTTFDGSYTYLGPDGSTELDPQWTVYVRNNGTINEVCGVFGSAQASTVCINAGNGSDWNTDFPEEYHSENPYNSSNTSLNGYTKAKLDEMLSKGATQCEVNNDSGYAGCSNADGLECHISEYGSVECSAADNLYYCNYNGCY